MTLFSVSSVLCFVGRTGTGILLLRVPDVSGSPVRDSVGENFMAAAYSRIRDRRPQAAADKCHDSSGCEYVRCIEDSGLLFFQSQCGFLR